MSASNDGGGPLTPDELKHGGSVDTHTDECAQPRGTSIAGSAWAQTNFRTSPTLGGANGHAITLGARPMAQRRYRAGTMHSTLTPDAARGRCHDAARTDFYNGRLKDGVYDHGRNNPRAELPLI